MASTKKKNNLRKQVRRDVRAAYAPVINAFDQQQEHARKQLQADLSRSGSIYGRFNESLAPLMAQLGQSAQQINTSAAQGIQGLTGAGQEAGMARLLQTMGQGHIANLGASQQGALSNVAAGATAANLNRADLESSVMRRYSDFVNDLSMQRADLKAQKAQTFLQQLQQAKEFRLAKKEQQLRAEQFDKEFSFTKNQTKRSNDNEDQAQSWAQKQLNEAERDQLRKKMQDWRTNAGIPDIKDEIADIRKQLSNEVLDPAQVNTLNEELDRLRRQLSNKKRRVRKKRTRYVRRHD